jgi:hypothetical protein
MSAPMTEFTIETILRDGLNELRLTPNKLDDVFSIFNSAFFSTQYADKIAEIKTYITNNQIKLTQALSLQPTDMPCISIQLISSEEHEDEQNFSNMLPEEDEAKTPTVLVPVVTPGTYDIVTGKLTVVNAADLSMICPGLIFVDNSGNKFEIGSGNSNLSGNKFINIGPGKEPDLSDDGFIESSIDIKRTDRRKIRLRETISLGCHAANNVHLAKFLYYIVVYIIKSRQLSMENRGLALDSHTASLFDREGQFEGEHIFSRHIQLNVLTTFEWDQEEVNLIDCFDISLKGASKDENGNEVIVDPLNTSG